MTQDELRQLIADNIVNTTEATNMMGCSRQYLHKLVTQGKLIPVKNMERDRVFLKADILARVKERKADDK